MGLLGSSKFILTFALLVGFGSVTAQAHLTVNQRKADFLQLVSSVERNYAPLRWKIRTIGLDWESHKEQYLRKIQRAENDFVFYQELTRFLMGLKDAHVTVQLPSSYEGDLGFVCDYMDGKVFLEHINRKRLPESLFPFQPGDELVAIDDVPVKDIMADLMELSQTGYDLSSKRLAAVFLTYRRQKRAVEVPNGPSTVSILRKGAAVPESQLVTWDTRGRPLVEIGGAFSEDETEDVNFGVSSSFETLLREQPLWNMSLPKNSLDDLQRIGLSDLGSLTSMFPLPEGSIQDPRSPITSVIFERDGKKIGILRVPRFDDEAVLRLLTQALFTMEEQVDVLVLDQTNNPGGRVDIVSNLSSIFFTESAKDVQFELRPSLGWYESFVSMNDTIERLLQSDPSHGAANTFGSRFRYFEELIRQGLEQGTFLVDPIGLDMTGGMGIIRAHESIHFTKPVLILINEFDFSGGDAFPAIMKDNGRAVLFGHRTTGAGGNVREYPPLTNSRFKYFLTESLIVRPNGTYLENLGVTPDIAYDVTALDAFGGYTDYVEAFTCAALSLVDTECSPAETGDTE